MAGMPPGDATRTHLALEVQVGEGTRLPRPPRDAPALLDSGGTHRPQAESSPRLQRL